MAEYRCAAIRCGDPVNNVGRPLNAAEPLGYFAAVSRFRGGLAYGFRATNDSKGGIEKDVVKECSGGWVPS